MTPQPFKTPPPRRGAARYLCDLVDGAYVPRRAESHNGITIVVTGFSPSPLESWRALDSCYTNHTNKETR